MINTKYIKKFIHVISHTLCHIKPVITFINVCLVFSIHYFNGGEGDNIFELFSLLKRQTIVDIGSFIFSRNTCHTIQEVSINNFFFFLYCKMTNILSFLDYVDKFVWLPVLTITSGLIGNTSNRFLV